MARWSEVEAAEPDFAARVRRRFETHRHSTLATLRKDGSPRISGIEVGFVDGDVILGMMADSLKAGDLRRDSRLALHSPSDDPPEDPEEQNTWPGDAKLAGKAIEQPNAEHPAEPSGRFSVELTEVVLTYVGTPPDHLVIESWHPDRGLERHIRR
ncbi:MAG TPA: pyridoxamine 5'-phosphate oxidase family protein [Chloroflexota bacterium]|nr:pyridoxamine 5'-phosphate oxidase family protein [Chloroflexota bacterium]